MNDTEPLDANDILIKTALRFDGYNHYVRQEERLSWEQAIHKMTGLAASHMGLQNRGTLRAGAWADLVLLDPDLVADRATPDDPQAVSVGIEKVWVNGELVWNDGEVTGARPGKALRRSVSQ